MSRFGIWQPMQSLAGFFCMRVSIGNLQLWFVWQVRHLPREIRRRLFAGRLHMRIVASNAAQPPLARAIALAQRHGIVVLDVVCRGRRLPRRRNHQDRQRVVERMSRAEVLVSFPGLENPHIAGLMAAHANVVCKIGGKTGGIDNAGIDGRAESFFG